MEEAYPRIHREGNVSLLTVDVDAVGISSTAIFILNGTF